MTPTARSVFLSYSPQDEPFVARLRRALRDHGLTPVDVRQVAAPGTSLEDALRQTLNTADWVVGVMTPRGQQSSITNFEIGYALAQGLPVMLVTREARYLEDMPMHLRRLVTVVTDQSPGEIASRLSRILQLLPPKAQTADFGSYLKQLMVRRRISQSALASAAGVSQSMLSRVLTNHAAPSVALFSALVLAFENLKVQLSEDELKAWMTLATQTFGPAEASQRGRRDSVKRRLRKSRDQQEKKKV